jgi:hypothetical protein
MSDRELVLQAISVAVCRQAGIGRTEAIAMSTEITDQDVAGLLGGTTTGRDIVDRIRNKATGPDDDQPE